jgi:hypothetical protein
MLWLMGARDAHHKPCPVAVATQASNALPVEQADRGGRTKKHQHQPTFRLLAFDPDGAVFGLPSTISSNSRQYDFLIDTLADALNQLVPD